MHCKDKKEGIEKTVQVNAVAFFNQEWQIYTKIALLLRVVRRTWKVRHGYGMKIFLVKFILQCKLLNCDIVKQTKWVQLFTAKN